MSSRADDRRTVFLARHGETEWNLVGRWQGATDTRLSDTGRAQARALAERLRRLGPEAVGQIHASDLDRAVETATIVAEALGLPAPRRDQRLRERGFGCFEGLTREECAVQHPEVWARYLADRRSTPPGAEPQETIVARVLEVMHEIASTAVAGQPPLVVSHGGAIRTFAHAALGVSLPPVGNGAVFRVLFAEGRFQELVEM
jgi:broad specificity phosphatase PhoE